MTKNIESSGYNQPMTDLIWKTIMPKTGHILVKSVVSTGLEMFRYTAIYHITAYEQLPWLLELGEGKSIK